MSLPRFPWFSSDGQARRRARELAKSDYDFHEQLVKIRHDRGMSQADVAELLGITQQAVSKLERIGADPRLSTLRQYSHAVGALVKHVAMQDEGQLQAHDEWVTVTFAPRFGATTTAPSSQFSVSAARTDLALAS